MRPWSGVRRAVPCLAGVLALAGAAACGEGDGGGATGAAGSAGSSGGGWEELRGPESAGAELAEAGGTVVVVAGGELRTLEGDRWLPGEEVPGPGTGSGPVVGTGDEVVVPSAGAAWSPGGETWREVPDSPVVATAAFAAGDELVVVDRAPDEARVAVLAAGATEWRPAEPLAGTMMAAAAIPGGAVVWTYDEPAAEAGLSRLDAATGRWSELPVPPFDPPGGGSGLAAGDDRLVATATTGTDSEAAVLDLAGGDWEPIDAPPVPGRAVCPSELQGGGGAVVFVAVCSGEPAVLSGDSWDALPAPPFDGTNAAVLVTGDELVVVAADGSAAARRPLP
jgi:hypothetical protein